MATPGFTAEYGLYRSTAHYQSLGSSDGHMQDSGQQPSRSSQVIVAGIDAAIVWGGPPWQRPEPCLPGYSFDPSTAQCVWGGVDALGALYSLRWNLLPTRGDLRGRQVLLHGRDLYGGPGLLRGQTGKPSGM